MSPVPPVPDKQRLLPECRTSSGYFQEQRDFCTGDTSHAVHFRRRRLPVMQWLELLLLWEILLRFISQTGVVAWITIYYPTGKSRADGEACIASVSAPAALMSHQAAARRSLTAPWFCLHEDWVSCPHGRLFPPDHEQGERFGDKQGMNASRASIRPVPHYSADRNRAYWDRPSHETLSEKSRVMRHTSFEV